VNKAITCTVVANNTAGNSAPAISPPIVPVALPAGLVPIETTPPVISGSPEQGQTVSCSKGSWLNSPSSYTFSWQRTGAGITGATGSSHTLTSADVNQAITCTVVAKNAVGGSAPAISAPIVPVGLPSGLIPIETTPPVISGSPEQGQTVACSKGSWLNSPKSYSYSWERNGSAIAGQSASSYKLTSADVNRALTCAVVAKNSAGSSAPAISAPILPVPLPTSAVPVETAPPVISGSPEEGQTVSCLTGTWTNDPTGFAYSWQRTGSTIAGANGSSYTLSAADAGQAITCTVIALNAAGLSAPAISLPIIPAGTPASTGSAPATAAQTPAPPVPTPTATPAAAPQPAPSPTVAPRPHAPTITSFSLSPARLTILVKGKSRSTKGTTFKYVLDQTAGVLIEIQQKLAGRKQGKNCVAVTKRNKHAKACTRWVKVRYLVAGAHAGSNSYKYRGRVGPANKVLTAGSYRVELVARNGNGWSALHQKGFTAARKLVKPKKQAAKKR
jgi:hypothetical protein